MRMAFDQEEEYSAAMKDKSAQDESSSVGAGNATTTPTPEMLLNISTIRSAKEGLQQEGCNKRVCESTTHKLESILALATEDLSRLKLELTAGGKTEERVSSALSQAFADLGQGKMVIERALRAVRNPCSAALSHGLPTVQELKRALKVSACLESSMKALQLELEAMRKELHDLREREENARAAILTLDREVSKEKDEAVLWDHSNTLETVNAECKVSGEVKKEATTTSMEHGGEESEDGYGGTDANEGRGLDLCLQKSHSPFGNAQIIQPRNSQTSQRTCDYCVKAEQNQGKLRKKQLLPSALLTLLGGPVAKHMA